MQLPYLSKGITAWPFIETKRYRQVLHALRHVQLTLQAFVQFYQGSPNLCQERIHTRALLRNKRHEEVALGMNRCTWYGLGLVVE